MEQPHNRQTVIRLQAAAVRIGETSEIYAAGAAVIQLRWKLTQLAQNFQCDGGGFLTF